MHHFFAQAGSISEDRIYITGSDYNHAVNVLRLRKGERVLVSGPDAKDYICLVESTGAGTERKLCLSIEKEAEGSHELPAEVVLFQCLPKSDRMETIIQKSVELGVREVVPVASRNCVMKLDPGREEARLRRWQAIAESAAKQSRRSMVPAVRRVMNIKEAFEYCEDYDVKLIPYELEEGLIGTCEAIISFLPGTRIAVFIGPEGGFDPLEISMALRHGIKPISLGKRILRTDTAAIAVLSLIMIRLEIAAEDGLLEM